MMDRSKSAKAHPWRRTWLTSEAAEQRDQKERRRRERKVKAGIKHSALNPEPTR